MCEYMRACGHVGVQHECVGGLTRSGLMERMEWVVTTGIEYSGTLAHKHSNK